MEALPSTTISASQIRSMFKGDSQPISFSQYYKGGTSVTYGSVSHPIVPDSIYTPNVPTSGQISFSNFRDSRKEYQIVFDSDKHQYSLSWDFDSKFTTSGESNKVPVLKNKVPLKVTIPSGITVWSTWVELPAFIITNNLSSNVYTSNVVNNGKIYGQGQRRIDANANNPAGRAIQVIWTGPTYILNYGEIKGGGGAGGNGGNGGDGGTGGTAHSLIASGAGGFNGTGYYTYYTQCFSYYCYCYYGCTQTGYFTCAGYVGGDHGYFGGLGGAGGSGGAGGDATVFTSPTDSSLVTAATSGASGGTGSTGGIGDYGRSTYFQSCGQISCYPGPGTSGASGGDGGTGGDGGDFGTSGTAGTAGTDGTASTPPGAISSATANSCNRGQRTPRNADVATYNADRLTLVYPGASGNGGNFGNPPGVSVYYGGGQDVTVVNNGTILPAI